MPIPNADRAVVAPQKLSDYLLNVHHPEGMGKAIWFHTLGYNASNPQTLERDLLSVVQSSNDYLEKPSSHGMKYIVDGTITTPKGRQVSVTTVWIVDIDRDELRLVTAYPGAKP